MSRRAAYNPVSSCDVEETEIHEPEEEEQQQQQEEQPPSRQGRRRNTNSTRNYSLVGAEDEEADDSPLKPDKGGKGTSSALEVDDDDDGNFDSGERITVVVLDSAQTKFPIEANPDWTIKQFKRVGGKIHKVAPASQRLIYRGKMLADGVTLRECGISKSDVIVHLFPKPRVVVTSSSAVSDAHPTSAGDNSEDPYNNDHGAGGGGAHIPQIILNEEEMERRGQILVLGSVEIAEAQNNVKLLSLLWLVVCSMRLLALFSIAMGVAGDPNVGYNDDYGPPVPSNNNSNNHTDNGYGPSPNGGDMQYETRPWQTEDYFDLAVHGIGFYVATLGMKATTENTLSLANAYMIGTIFIGIGWNIWNAFMYLMFVEEETAQQHQHQSPSSSSDNNGTNDDDDTIPLTRDDYVTVAFVTVILPAMVWVLCCLRAWQFRQLLEEAELEAAERVRSQLTTEDDDTDDVENGNTTAAIENERELTELRRSTTDTTVSTEMTRPTIV